MTSFYHSGTQVFVKIIALNHYIHLSPNGSDYVITPTYTKSKMKGFRGRIIVKVTHLLVVERFCYHCKADHPLISLSSSLIHDRGGNDTAL